MKKVTFQKKFRRYKIGETHEIQDNIANVLVKMRVATYDTKVIETPSVSVSKPVADPVQKVIQSPVEQPVTEKKKPGRKKKSDKTYETRMMEAE